MTFSRIRCPRSSDPLAFGVAQHAASHLIAHAEPELPEEAAALGIEGKVTLNAVIGKDGSIQELVVHEGHPLLAQAALETVRHWAYRPTTVNGIAVEVETEIDVEFRATSKHGA